MAFQSAEAGAAAIALPFARSVAPEEHAFARAVVGTGRPVQHEQDVVFLDDGALASVSVGPEPHADGFGEIPGRRDNHVALRFTFERKVSGQRKRVNTPLPWEFFGQEFFPEFRGGWNCISQSPAVPNPPENNSEFVCPHSSAFLPGQIRAGEWGQMNFSKEGRWF